MANKRDSSKQKRARQNRAQRAALEARTKAASEPRSSYVTQPPGSNPKATTPAADTGEAKAKGGLFGGPRQPRAPRPGDLPVDIDTLEGSWWAKRLMVPGGRQVLTGGVLTVVLTVMMAFTKSPPRGQPKAKATETIFELWGWWAIPILLAPIVVMAVAAQMTLSPHRRRIWIAGTFILAIQFLIAPAYLFPAGFLTYAVWRSSKIEGSSKARSDDAAANNRSS